MSIDVRPPRKTEVRTLARTLGRAFYDDPVMEWLLPTDARRAKGLPRLFGAMTRHHFLAGGAVEVALRSGEIGAAALWDPPGRWKHSPREEFMMIPGFLLAMGGRTARGRQIAELMKKQHPEEPRTWP